MPYFRFRLELRIKNFLLRFFEFYYVPVKDRSGTPEEIYTIMSLLAFQKAEGYRIKNFLYFHNSNVQFVFEIFYKKYIYVRKKTHIKYSSDTAEKLKLLQNNNFKYNYLIKCYSNNKIFLYVRDIEKHSIKWLEHQILYSNEEK